MIESDLIGSVIDGKYRIARTIGAGAMGSVFEAESTQSGKRVALKVINAGDISKNASLVTRFQREAKAAGAIATEHITQVLDAGTDRDSGLPYMAMELLVGEDLSQALHRIGPFAPDLALRVVAQACVGLQKAHEANVVHRDIKPANLFLTQREDGELLVKLLDFGIAKVKMEHANETENAGLTRTGSMLGSPLYMSPEQARGTRQIDHRADIWSLGIVLYQLLSGRTPYHDIQALGELIIAICHDAPPHIQDYAPWVPPEVAAIVHRAVRQPPSERYESAAAMLAAIKPLLPNGWAIRSEMLVPMPEGLRRYVAGRLEITSPMEGAATVAQTGDQRLSSPGIAVRVSSPDIAVRVSSISSPDLAGRGSMPGSMPDGVNTASPLTQSQTQVPKERSGSSKAPLLIGVVLTAALVGGGVYMLTKQQGPAQGVEIAAQPTAPAAPTPAPTPSVTPDSTTLAAPPAAPAPRRVKLVIEPTDASVEVEGVATKASNGIIEITGAPGSVHRVRLFKGKRETITDVIITEAGPAPPKVELAKTVVKDPGAGTKKPTRPGITDKFE